MDMPADWAIERALVPHTGWTPEDVRCQVGYGSHLAQTIDAFARYIEAHEQPPVDPDLVTAREICAVVAEGLGNPVVAHGYRKGSNDTGERIQFALAKLKEARGK